MSIHALITRDLWEANVKSNKQIKLLLFQDWKTPRSDTR
jgi:hypothetical protein